MRIIETDYRGALVQARHAHPDTTVSIVLRGVLRETVGGVSEVAGPFSIVVKPSGTEHVDQFSSEGARLLQIRFDGYADDFGRAAPALRRWRWTHGGSAVRAFLTVASLRRAASVDRTSADPAAGTTDVTVAAVDAIAALDEPCDPQGRPPAWLRAVRERLDDETAPRVSEIATDASVHPVYLARCFRRAYGRSITEHLRWRRLQRAAHAIAFRGATFSRVAADSGYADHAHLCRDFRSAVGLTPTAFRALAAR